MYMYKGLKYSVQVGGFATVWAADLQSTSVKGLKYSVQVGGFAIV